MSGKVNAVTVRWDGAHRFDGGRPGSAATIRLDASGETGPSPVDALLCALASCTGVDVVDILEKRRTPIASLDIAVTGHRADAVPARLTAIELHYRIGGAGIERVHAERAIELAVTKYCSVRDSLDPNLKVTWTLELSA
ncbi:MAG: OsmC family protein [Gemmatimonadota bacterium]